jgi:cullin-4
MDDQKMQDLGQLYNALQRVGALDKLRRHFSTYTQTVGYTFVSDPSRDLQMVESVLNFKKKLDEIVEKSFQKLTLFTNTIKEAFEAFINRRANKPAEMIAKHVDGLLRTSKGLTEEEVESRLDQCLVLFRFIQGGCISF